MVGGMATTAPVKQRNVHVPVDPAFHRRLKMMVASKGVSLVSYARKALEAQLNRDEGPARR